MKNYVIRAMDENKSIRIFIADTTNLVQEIRNIHGTSATASAALGRLATVALLMGITSKNLDESWTIRFDGNGLGGKLTAVSNPSGEVKVMATNPKADCEPKAVGKLDVAKYVGTDGTVSVVRDYGLKEPYTGVSNIVSGEIAEDIASYYYYSEQTPSVVSLGVLVNPDLSINAAGGIFVQTLPSIKEEDLIKLEKIVQELKPVSSMISSGMTPEDILEKHFNALNPEIIDKQELVYKCDCNEEKVEKALISIGRNDLEHLLEEDGEAEIICDFCRTRYHFDKEHLERLIEESK